MSLLDTLTGRSVRELRLRMERSIKASEKLSRALTSSERKMDALIKALDAHREAMEKLYRELNK